MFLAGKNSIKYAKAIFLGVIGLYFLAGGQVFASTQTLNENQVFAPGRIVVAQSFEEQREQNRREFEKRSEQNRREFDERVRKNQEWFDQRTKESNDRFDKFATIAIAFGIISLLVKLLGIYVASKRK